MENLVGVYIGGTKCAVILGSHIFILKQTYVNGGKALICGNGGSATDSEHIVGELMKGFMLKRSLSKEHRECA